jgi:heat shock protein HslJ
MTYLKLNSLLMALFCCLFLAACAGGCGGGDDMAEMADDDATTEAHADAGHDMDEMDDMDHDEMDDDGAGAAAMAAEGEELVAAEDLHAVEGHTAAMATAAIELNVDEVKLPDYGWQLKWFGANEINQPPGADITLRFAVGTLGGNSGCNEYNGSYERGAEEKSLSMGEVASTRKMCPDDVMGAEQRYLGILRSVSHYEFKKDGLHLFNPAGDWLHYVPEQPESE